MTISGDITQDKRFPFPQQTLVVRARGVTLGRRVRFRLTLVPPGSGLATYTAATPNAGWLPSVEESATTWAGKLVPDTDGVYYVEAVEESYDGTAPHYDTHETNLSDDWTEVTTETLAVYVGARLQFELGVDPDTSKLVVHTAQMTSANYAAGWGGYGGGDAGPSGVVTSSWDLTVCPEIQDAQSDKALLARDTTLVKEMLARMGGVGYSGGASVFSYIGLGDYAGSLLNSLITAYNNHRVYVATATVHGLKNASTQFSAMGTATLANLLTYCETAKLKHNTHIAVTGSVHATADAVNTISYGITAATTTAQAVAMLNEWNQEAEDHYESNVYHVGSDQRRTVRTDRYHFGLPTTATLASACTYASSLGVSHNIHVTGSTAGTSPYHSAADTDNAVDNGSWVLAYTSCSVDELVRYANLLADNLHAHTQNIKWSDKSSAAYHAAVDYGSSLEEIPRANDYATAVKLVHNCYWTFVRHIDHNQNENWHGHNNAIHMFHADCVGWLNKLYRDATASASVAASSTLTLTSTNTLLTRAGFSKA